MRVWYNSGRPLFVVVGALCAFALLFQYDALQALDWEEWAFIAGAAIYAIRESSRERKLDALAIDHAERLAHLEANNDDSLTLEGRLRAVEIYVEREENTEQRLALLQERIACLETRAQLEDEQ